MLQSSKEEPLLEVKIDRPPQLGHYLHAPGFYIEGSVRLQNCPLDCHRNDLHITLSGLAKSKVSGEGKRDGWCRASLLNINQSCPGFELHASSDLTWRFRIQVPTNCHLEKGQDPPYERPWFEPEFYFYKAWVPELPYVCQPHQPLPPSFRSKGEALTNRNYIAYKIQAKLSIDTASGSATLSDEQEAFLTRGPPEEPPPPQLDQGRITVQSSALGIDNRGSLTLRQKASNLLSKAKQPAFTFLWRTTLASHAVIGSPLQLHLALFPAPENGDETAIPSQITVDSVRIKARCFMRWRAPLHNQFVSEHYTRDIDESTSEFDQKLPAGSVPVLRAENNWTTFARTEPFSAHFPNFSTYNLSRMYDLEVKWSLRCAGDKHVIETQVSNIDIHAPALRQSRVGNCMKIARDGTAGGLTQKTIEALERQPPLYNAKEVADAIDAPLYKYKPLNVVMH